MKYTVEVTNDAIFWYKENTNTLHRENGPAIECSKGTKMWYQNSERHRLDGPAIEWFDGNKSWWQNDQCHRLDGPAIEYANGDKLYYIKGKEYSKEDFDKKIKEFSTPSSSCENKVVEIDGIKYKLTKV